MTKYRPRKKAFIGALIGAASIGTSIFNGIKQRKAQQQQRLDENRNEDLQIARQSATNLNNTLENADAYRDVFRNQYMRCGGRTKKDYGGNTNSNNIITEAVLQRYGGRRCKKCGGRKR